MTSNVTPAHCIASPRIVGFRGVQTCITPPPHGQSGPMARRGKVEEVVNAWVVARKSPIHGMGLFARTEIPAGTYLIEYTGPRISKAESLKQCENGNVYIFTLNDDCDIDGSVEWNPARFANHSCDPNCEAEIDEDDRVWIVSLRKIQPGEEITYNYGYDLEDCWDYPCRCGARNCIGYIVAEEYWPVVRRRLAYKRAARRKNHSKRPRRGASTEPTAARA